MSAAPNLEYHHFMARVLIVDDEPSIRETFSHFLVKAGHDVLCAADATEALRLLAQAPVDLVFSDIILPGQHGDALLERLLHAENAPTVVLVTGQPDFTAMGQLIQRGAYDYIPKPIHKETLLKVVRSALEHRAVSVERSRLAAENARIREDLKRLIEERAAATRRDTRHQEHSQRLLACQRDLAVALSHVETAPGAYEAILNTLQSLPGVDFSAVYCVSSAAPDAPLTLKGQRDMPFSFLDQVRVIPPGGTFHSLLMDGRLRHADAAAIRNLPEPARTSLLEARVRSTAAAPIFSHGLVLGALCTASTTLDVMDEETPAALEAMATCVVGALTRCLKLDDAPFENPSA